MTDVAVPWPTTLKEHCRRFGYGYRMRKQGRRYYVTISAGIGPHVSPDWVNHYRRIVQHYYPDAYMTSGSSTGATFMVGDVFEMLKK